MLIHLSPRLLINGFPRDLCTLVDLRIEGLGLHLRNGKELTVRTPYPNKNYLVACRKTGRKAINGIFVESPDETKDFTLVTRWAVGAENIVTHQVKYGVLDSDFDTVSEAMLLWYGGCDGFLSRWPTEGFPKGAPIDLQPCMELCPGLSRLGEVEDTCSGEGRITERKEVFRLPTIERGRLFGGVASTLRFPMLEDAFISPLVHNIAR